MDFRSISLRRQEQDERLVASGKLRIARVNLGRAVQLDEKNVVGIRVVARSPMPGEPQGMSGTVSPIASGRSSSRRVTHAWERGPQ